ncbi:hypothetical protein MYU51_017587 [Penicillium brevicompactum]|uniref:uncharacterized protein n=1 Tax=Penicillium brevicompactum TaxID=5074 RepID=UPI00253FE088|nr:uncharacterized protein N7506_010268 [Penicillium brevicompactum]KAJ5327166.1 hypothetical protein N7506_010268 [Penicillium brevicompactum]
MSPSLLQISAGSFVLLSVGHTIMGREWTSDPRFKAIAGSKPWASGTVGWYQGSGFLLIAGLLHWQWARDPSLLHEPLTKAIAGIMNVLLWASSFWYAKHGIKDTASVVGLCAALQAWAVAKA